MVEKLIAELAGGRELIAQAEAFDEEVEYWGRVGDRIFNGNILAEHFKFRANELRAQAKQPAEPQGEPVLVVQKEPDYHSRGHYYEGKKSWIDPFKIYALPIGTKLYAHPDPRIAALERVLTELNECGAINNWLRVSDDLRKRICVAMGWNDG